MSDLCICDLSDSIVLRVFQWLSMDDICLGVRKACWKWNDLSYDQSLWRMLDFSHRTWRTTDVTIKQALQKIQHHVHIINLEDCHLVNCEGLLYEETHCINLKSINVSGTEITTGILETLSQRYPALQKLLVKDCYNVFSFGSIFSNFGQLQQLRVSLEGNDSPDDVSSVLAYIVSLRDLAVIDAKALKDSHLHQIFKNIQLSKLSVAGCSNVGDDGIQCIAHSLGDIRCLDISETLVTDKGMKIIAESCPLIEELNTSLCRSVTDVGLAEVARQCPNLNKLLVNTCHANGANMTDVGLTDVAMHSPTLRVLKIVCCPQVSVTGIGYLAAYCKNLTELDISQCLGVTDDALKLLGRESKYLQVVEAAGCLQLTSVGVNALLSGCLYLTTLHIENCHYVKGFCHLQDLPRKNRLRNATHTNQLVTLDDTDNTSQKEAVESARLRDPD